MANKYADRLPFSLKGDFITSKPMKFGGKTYKVGEDFPHTRLAISDRRVRTLYEGKFLAMKGDEQPDEPEEVTELVAGEGEFIFDPEIHTMEHENSEYWIADEDGDLLRVRAPMGKKLDTSTDKVLVTAEDIISWAEVDEDDDEPEEEDT